MQQRCAATGATHPGKYEMEQSLWKLVPHELARLPLGIYPSKMETYFQIKTCMKTFTDALLIITQNRKQPEYSFN